MPKACELFIRSRTSGLLHHGFSSEFKSLSLTRSVMFVWWMKDRSVFLCSILFKVSPSSFCRVHGFQYQVQVAGAASHCSFCSGSRLWAVAWPFLWFTECKILVSLPRTIPRSLCLCCPLAGMHTLEGQGSLPKDSPLCLQREDPESGSRELVNKYLFQWMNQDDK